MTLGSPDREEDMQHPPEAWIKPHYAEYELGEIVGEWLAELEARPVSPNTVIAYRKAMLSFQKSLRLNVRPVTLAELTPGNVNRWKLDMRAGRIPRNEGDTPHNAWRTRCIKPYAEATVHNYLIAIKVFSKRWVRRRFSTIDLLELVELGKLSVVYKDGLSSKERQVLLASLDGNTFENIRDRAFTQMLLATALRFNEVHQLRLDRLDVEQKRAWVIVKGGRTEPVDIEAHAMRDLKVYLGRRRLCAAPGEQSVWCTELGRPLSYDGAQDIYRRLAARTGIKCNPHRFRHTVAQEAARTGAPVADIQDLLRHKSDKISRRYIGEARSEVAAGLATRYSLAV